MPYRATATALAATAHLPVTHFAKRQKQWVRQSPSIVDDIFQLRLYIASFYLLIHLSLAASYYYFIICYAYYHIDCQLLYTYAIATNEILIMPFDASLIDGPSALATYTLAFISWVAAYLFAT